MMAPRQRSSNRAARSRQGIDPGLRLQLVRLIELGKRENRWTRKRPTEWRPQEVTNPDPESWAGYFSDASAWALIAEELTKGTDVERKRLKRPPGARAFVMKVKLEGDGRLLYIKLELGHSRVFGRSFHYSEHD